MTFTQLANYLDKLDKTSKRLEITSIIAELINEVDQNEIYATIYLILGSLKAPFENPKFNIADKMVIRVIEYAYSKPNQIIKAEEVTQKYRECGDLGDVVAIYAPTVKSKLNILEVYRSLSEIASIEGAGSQENKVKKTAELLKNLDNLSAKFVTRIILGTTRLGFTELTIIDALAQSLGDKSLKDQIETVYNIHPDIGLIAQRLKEHGLKGINKITIEPGVPVLAQKAQRLGNDKSTFEEVFTKMPVAWAEFKFDGTRVQLHINKKKQVKSTSEQSELFNINKDTYLVKTYTRNQEDTTHQFPDIIEAAKIQLDIESVILDGEAIGYNRETGKFLPFQETIQRKRKHGIAEAVANIPLKYFVFDILYLNGKSLIDTPLTERREILKKILKKGEILQLSENIQAETPDQLKEYYEIAKEDQLEGLIVKNPNDPYQAGARSFSWIKIKKADQKLLEDSVDVVVLGYYAGKGVRNKFGIGGFLVGVYDDASETFKSITKVGTGLTDGDWATLKTMCDKHKRNDRPQNVEMNKLYNPDVWLNPKVVVELGADEISISQTHTAGYALRFPRLLNFRADKNALESTSLQEIKEMFERQKNG